jgi:hypothetical protein
MCRGRLQPDPPEEMPAADQVQHGRRGHGVHVRHVPQAGRRHRLRRLRPIRPGRLHPLHHIQKIRQGTCSSRQNLFTNYFSIKKMMTFFNSFTTCNMAT